MAVTLRKALADTHILMLNSIIYVYIDIADALPTDKHSLVPSVLT